LASSREMASGVVAASTQRMGPRAAAAVLDVGEEDVPNEPAPASSTGARQVSVGGAHRPARQRA
jgi:hypothetical protein